VKGSLSLEQENEVRRLRSSIQDREHLVMEQFRTIINETAFDLDPICVYVIMDKLRGMHNSASIPDKSYRKAEQMLKVLGVDKHWA
jgi:hypothetical protein